MAPHRVELGLGSVHVRGKRRTSKLHYPLRQCPNRQGTQEKMSLGLNVFFYISTTNNHAPYAPSTLLPHPRGRSCLSQSMNYSQSFCSPVLACVYWIPVVIMYFTCSSSQTSLRVHFSVLYGLHLPFLGQDYMPISFYASSPVKQKTTVDSSPLVVISRQASWWSMR